MTDINRSLKIPKLTFKDSASDNKEEDDIIATFEHQAKNPPGGDKYIAYFFKGLLLSENKKTHLIKYVEKVHAKRNKLGKSFTNTHLATLLFRSFQYIKLYKSGVYENIHYVDRLKNVRDWEREFYLILNKRKKFLFDILVHREVVSNIPSRYAGINGLLNIIYPNQHVAIIDLGSSSHQGIRTIMQISLGKERFNGIKDVTSQQIVINNMNKPLHIDVGVGVDQFDFSSSKELEWLLACTHRPENLDDIPIIRSRLERLRNTPRTPFIKADLRKIKSLKLGRFTVAILSSVLYQLTPKERNKVFEGVYGLLKNDGIILIQDHTYKTKKGLVFTDGIGVRFSYGLFGIGPKTKGKLYEILRYSDNRCKLIKPGADFEEAINL